MLKTVLDQDLDSGWFPPAESSDEEESSRNDQSVESMRDQSSSSSAAPTEVTLEVLHEARSLYQSVEIDMGQEELGVRVAQWKCAVNLMLK
jgi:hypothetical protein